MQLDVHALRLRGTGRVARCARFAALALALGACSSASDGAGGGAKVALELGPPTALGSETIDAAGGKLVVASGDGALAGLAVEVPAGAFTGATTIELSARPIAKHEAGAAFHPLTPLISIKASAAFAAKVVRVTIPVEVPAGHFAAPFAYLAGQGRLEALPLVAADARSVTVALRSLTRPAPGASAQALAGKGDDTSQPSSGELAFVVSSVAEEQLGGVAASQLVPGDDAWPFPNYGSWIALEGCGAGHAASALWYYHDRRAAGGPPLRQLADATTPDFWLDDAQGIRLTCSVELDLAAAEWDAALAEFAAAGTSSTYHAIAYALTLTGLPQLVALEGEAGALLLVAYRAEGGRVAVVDPSYAGAGAARELTFTGGAFGAYTSARQALAVEQGQTSSYARAHHLGVFSLLDWRALLDRWLELEDGAAGADRFPQYAFGTDAGPLQSGLKVDAAQLVVGASLGAVSKEGYSLKVSAYRREGGTIAATEIKGLLADPTEKTVSFSLPLEEGKNVLGLGVYIGDSAHDGKEGWTGFEWFEVERGAGGAKSCNGTPDGSDVCVDNACYNCSVGSEKPLVFLYDCGAAGCTVTNQLCECN